MRSREKVREGCLYEIWAALVTLWQGRHAGDPGVRSSMRCIARDEVSHATLSWDLAAWLVLHLSRTERAEVDAALADAVAALEAALQCEKDPQRVRVAGIPDAAAERVLWSQPAPQLRAAPRARSSVAAGGE